MTGVSVGSAMIGANVSTHEASTLSPVGRSALLLLLLVLVSSSLVSAATSCVVSSYVLS